MISVVITGSRDWPMSKAPIIWSALRKLQKRHTGFKFTLHEGECPFGGADLIAASWADGAGWKVVPHPPKEQTGYHYALRNQEMIDTDPDYVVACFLNGAGNRGTQMTYDMAVKAGLGHKIIKVRA